MQSTALWQTRESYTHEHTAQASDIIKKGKMCSLFINDLDAGAGRMGEGTQYTVNNQMVSLAEVKRVKCLPFFSTELCFIPVCSAHPALCFGLLRSMRTGLKVEPSAQLSGCSAAQHEN